MASSSPITRLTSLDVNPASSNGVDPDAQYGFYLPQMTSAAIAAIPANILKNGALVLNSTLGFTQIYLNNEWYNITVSNVGASGVGLLNNVPPVIFPHGVNNQVEVGGNDINGFIYYDTTSNTIRTYVDGNWVTVQTA